MTSPLAIDVAAAAPAARAEHVRADIQALRAIAVGLVVAYHFFPGLVPGGFVGVDVFFVISGFLITSHLLNRPPRRARDLAEFWGRRIRRLLPASFVVLAVTLAATLLVAPQTVWENTAKQVAASALYVENWFLAGEAVDYLAADNAASPVQHFWSLSVEEQFYLVWPILVLAAAWVAIRRGVGVRSAVATAIAIVIAGSFAVSVTLSVTDPAAAYFVSWTRAWELALGGLAACLFPGVQRALGDRSAVRTAAAWTGLAAIVFAAFAFSGALPFPGWIAAIPVVGTAIVLVAAVSPGRFSPLGAMSWRPAQFLGDTSYSVYLWHWPLVVLVPYALSRPLTWGEKGIAIAATLVLAWATKVWVEDRFRGRRPLGAPLRRSFAFMIVGMVVIAGAAGAVAYGVGAGQRAVEAEVEQKLTELFERQHTSPSDDSAAPASCFAADALVHAECDPHGDELVTDPVFAAADKPAPYDDGCWILGSLADQKTCHYGSDLPGAKRVALVGNSHAGHWLPALQVLAAEHGWSITTYLISICYTVDVPIDFDSEGKSRNCSAWNDRVIDEVANEKYDLVVMSNYTANPLAGMDMAATMPAAERAYGRVIDGWADAGVPVLVLRDTPYAKDLENVPDCVAAHLDDLSACDGTRSRLQPDPLAAAAERRTGDPRIGLVDLTDRMCRGDVCYSVAGGVIVYFDRGHLTATFSQSLSPLIAPEAQRLLSH